jgi:putative ABC transport system permease protein
VSVGPGWRRLLRLTRDEDALEREVDEELEFHLAMREEKLRRHGVSIDEARAEAHARFGDTMHVREECLDIDRQHTREAKLMDWLESVVGDLRFAYRTLRRAPVFTVVVTVTLALGIGATSAMFSLVDGILLRPLPFTRPDRLVRVIQSYPEKGLDTWTLSQQNVAWYRARVHDFSSFAAYARRSVTLTGEGTPERLAVARVTGEFFSVLGAEPIRGRMIGPDDDRPRAASVAVLSYGYWQSRFAGRDVLGKTIDLDGTPTTVVGVASSDFVFFAKSDVQLYLPVGLDPTARFGWFLTGIGRLRPEATADRAAKDATAAMWDWARQNPDLLAATPIDPAKTQMHAIVTPLRDAMTGDVARPLVVLQAAVLLLLLIAVANIATLQSSRGAARAPEIAIRTALGATPKRIGRQLLTESMVLAIGGGALGLIVAAAAVRGFIHWSPPSVPRVASVRVDGSVVAFALLVTLLSGLLFGLSPALRVARTKRLADDLSGSQRRSAGASARRLNNALILAQFALSTVLLVSAGLVSKSFGRLVATDLGFDARDVLSASLALPAQNFADQAAVATATQAIVDRISALPGVTGAAAAWTLPYSGNMNTDGFLVEGHAPPANAGAETQVVQVAVTPGFFDALKIRLRYGRDVSRQDRAGTQPVVVVDDALARRYWAGADAIGKRMRFTGDTTWRTIVGVVASVKDQDVIAEPLPHAYQPYAQAPGLRPSLAVRVVGDPAPVVAQLRRIVKELEPETPITGVQPLANSIGQALDNRRLTEMLLAGFALVAAALAAVGIYGLMALYVANRGREFGIRLAIGARPAALVRLVLGQGLLLAAIGLAVGIAAALAATRSLGSLLYDVSPADPGVYAAIAAGLFATAALSCFAPARRAARADPLAALRAD